MEFRFSFAKCIEKSTQVTRPDTGDFSEVSSKTYLSTLERRQKSPTLDKIDAISQTIGIHFLSLLALTCLYSGKTGKIDSVHRDELT